MGKQPERGENSPAPENSTSRVLKDRWDRLIEVDDATYAYAYDLEQVLAHNSDLDYRNNQLFTEHLYPGSTELSPEELATARHQLILANTRLAFDAATNMYDGRVPLEDLIQEANVALARAAQGFDVRRGYAFSSYAVDAMKFRFWAVYETVGGVRFTDAEWKKIRNVWQYRRQHALEHPHDLINEREMSETLGIPMLELKALIDASSDFYDLDEPLHDTEEDKETYLDLIGVIDEDLQQIENQDQYHFSEWIAMYLPIPELVKVLVLRYEQGLAPEEIAQTQVIQHPTSKRKIVRGVEVAELEDAAIRILKKNMNNISYRRLIAKLAGEN